MKSISIKTKKGNEINLCVDRKYIVIYRDNGLQYELSDTIISLSENFIKLEGKTVELSQIEDIIDITI